MLRVLLVMFVLGLLLASGLLYIVSLDLAAQHPELARIRMPVYVAMLVGLRPWSSPSRSPTPYAWSKPLPPSLARFGLSLIHI